MHSPAEHKLLPSLRGLCAASVLSLVASLAACGDTADATTDTSDTAAADAVDTNDTSDTLSPDSASPDTAAPDTTDTAPDTTEPADTRTETDVVLDAPLGGARPATVVVPESYQPGTPTPLVILLHGYSATGAIQDLYLDFSPRAAASGFIAIVPEGTTNPSGLQFWNASPGWCCDFLRSGVDDQGYLLSLIDEASRRFTIDPKRVYLVGHSNGGFMAHTMACNHADRIAAIVSIAGSLPLDAADCAPSEPVSVLQVHGTFDAVIAYNGVLGQFPSAETVVSRWASHDGCEALPQSDPTMDYDGAVFGAETHPLPYPGCTHSAVALWRMDGSAHIPGFTPAFIPAALDWLLAHPKAP
ncbi:MAG: alpha/beta fold hydrolase [Deltaproteobacteria bacterium]|nr:alpha/beta fold hydrolase [Deltaproteobacteria bacterium]